MIQMVRPRPSVPVVEPRPTRTIAGQSITRQTDKNINTNENIKANTNKK